jgi:hypothetical protein
MRIRVWISGAEGPSLDFELAEAPRVGERISISTGGRLDEGVVTSVVWQLVGVERTSKDLTLGFEPVGSVTMVHVICKPSNGGDAALLGRTLRDEAPA